MNARMLALGLALIGVAGTACSRSEPESEPAPAASQPYAASGGLPESDPPQLPPADQTATATPADDSTTMPAADDVTQSAPAPTSPSANAPGTSTSGANAPRTFALESNQPSAAPATTEKADGKRLELRPDLPPAELLKFLAGADTDMQVISSGRSGIEDPQKARELLVQIVKMKLEASRRLAAHPDADDAAKSEGTRGELQSLSHLASMGDVKAAEQLEQLAKNNLQADDPKLVADSRLVLIGFAIESLQNGNPDAAAQIVQYVDQIAASPTPPDVPAMMVMGQARQLLAGYGHDAEARRVRDVIIELFADSPEPQIAEMAAQVAGNVRFDTVDQLLRQVLEGESVNPDQWTAAADTLIDESADLQTVQYLAGAALEFEAQGHADLAEATYQLLSQRFQDPGSAMHREVELAVEAREARRQVIGRVFDPDLPAADGQPLDLQDHRGKVVLMPFWAMGFPESLQLTTQLKAIRDAHPDQVTIVGVNLDAEGAPVREFLQENDLGFRSFRSESSATGDVANEVAVQFGLVSMPAVAVLDQQGRVSMLTFTGRELQSTVDRLLAESIEN